MGKPRSCQPPETDRKPRPLGPTPRLIGKLSLRWESDK